MGARGCDRVSGGRGGDSASRGRRGVAWREGETALSAACGFAQTATARGLLKPTARGGRGWVW
jgi:hypothetical protein